MKKEKTKQKNFDYLETKKFLIKYFKKIKFAVFSPVKFFCKYKKEFKEIFIGDNLEKVEISEQYQKQKQKFDKKNFDKNPKVLILVNHYYNKNNEFRGKSATQEMKVRRNIIEKVIAELRKIPNADIKICGIKGFSLVDIDIDFSFSDPKF
nr:hypothetical protein [Patescibacteria group bacterium]